MLKRSQRPIHGAACTSEVKSKSKEVKPVRTHYKGLVGKHFYLDLDPRDLRMLAKRLEKHGAIIDQFFSSESQYVVVKSKEIIDQIEDHIKAIYRISSRRGPGQWDSVDFGRCKKPHDIPQRHKLYERILDQRCFPQHKKSGAGLPNVYCNTLDQVQRRLDEIERKGKHDRRSSSEQERQRELIPPFLKIEDAFSHYRTRVYERQIVPKIVFNHTGSRWRRSPFATLEDREQFHQRVEDRKRKREVAEHKRKRKPKPLQNIVIGERVPPKEDVDTRDSMVSQKPGPSTLSTATDISAAAADTAAYVEEHSMIDPLDDVEVCGELREFNNEMFFPGDESFEGRFTTSRSASTTSTSTLFQRLQSGVDALVASSFESFYGYEPESIVDRSMTKALLMEEESVSVKEDADELTLSYRYAPPSARKPSPAPPRPLLPAVPCALSCSLLQHPCVNTVKPEYPYTQNAVSSSVSNSSWVSCEQGIVSREDSTQRLKASDSTNTMTFEGTWCKQSEPAASTDSCKVLENTVEFGTAVSKSRRSGRVKGYTPATVKSRRVRVVPPAPHTASLATPTRRVRPRTSQRLFSDSVPQRKSARIASDSGEVENTVFNRCSPPTPVIRKRH